MNIKKVLKTEAESLLKNKDINQKKVKEYLMSFRFTDGHIHHVLDDNSRVNDDLVEDLLAYTNLDFPTQVTEKEPPEKIVFHNRQAIGDILTMTCAIRDFKNKFPEVTVGVSTTAMHIWDNNPYIDHSFSDSRYQLKIGPGFLTNKSNFLNLHMCNAFRVDIENKTGLSIPQGPIRPDIWMTEEEYKRPPLIDGPYWVFIYGGEPGWPSKQYHRWQEVINLLRDDIQFVQLGVQHHPYPKLNGVIDYIGKTENRDTGIRDLFNIFLHSQGSLGLVSMHMHLSAAFGNPCVVVNGAREPAWFTNYFGHQYLQTNGTMFCGEHSSCWACKLEGCKNLVTPKYITPGHNTKRVPKCVDIIEPEEIAEAVRKYYKGQRLKYGKKIPNKFFKNIVKEAKVFSIPKPEAVDEKLLQKYGFKWGGYSITDRDWLFIKDIIKDDKVKTILEFGTGLSTLLMGSLVDKIETHETIQSWIDKIKSMADPTKHVFKIWDGKNANLGNKHYDMVFVDGPPGGENREWSIKYASEVSDIVIVHDAGRAEEQKWQTKYLANDFKLIAKGGHRCHYWKRKNKVKVKIYENEGVNKPLARMVTTTRGYGGSERSTIEIMRMLQERGYHVQLCPTSNISWEYKKNIPDGVQILTEWSHVTASCDVLILYCSDTIWNYKQTKYTSYMSNLDAKRKVMVVNFKVGGVGQVDWTKGWDKYLFLSSLLEEETKNRMPDIITKVMAPPTSLDLFFEIKPNYELPLRLIRHNSQGDNKHHPDTNKMIKEIMNLVSDVEFHFMPAYSKCLDHPKVFKYPKNKPPVWQFLKYGNCFWYRLPEGYTEGGPKVIMEAMAAGLPVIADNFSGPKDRITPDIGWLCDSWEDYKKVIKEIISNPKLLEIKGKAAREYAKQEFVPERWIEEILK